MADRGALSRVQPTGSRHRRTDAAEVDAP